MAEIEGVAKRYDGSPVDYVSIFNWDDGKCIAQVVPNASGAWSYQYFKQLRVGITYVANGCEPITHGAYDFTVSGYKYWRVINITVRTEAFPVRSAAELRFINSEGIDSNVPSKGFSESIFAAEYKAGNAFDGNPSTMAHREPFGTNNQQGYLYYIGYQFDTPVTVTSIAVQMRQDMTPDFGQEWQTADVEFSGDGIEWLKYGTIEPRIASMYLSLVTTPVI